MKRSRIDFAAPSLYRCAVQSGPVTWAFAMAGVALLGSGLAVAQHYAQQAAQWQAQRQAVAAKRTPTPTIAVHSMPITPAQATAVNGMIARLNVPWRELFNAMESATPADRIALLELTPDPARRALKGVAEARNSEEMLAYVTRLGAQPFFASVVLVGHEINEQDANRPLRFQFTAQWREPVAGAGMVTGAGPSGS